MTSSVAERSSHALCATPTYTFTDVRVPVVCDVNDYWRRWTGDDNLGVRTVKGELWKMSTTFSTQSTTVWTNLPLRDARKEGREKIDRYMPGWVYG